MRYVYQVSQAVTNAIDFFLSQTLNIWNHRIVSFENLGK